MSKSNTFENDWLKLIFHGTAIANLADNAASSPLTSLYVSLHSADPGESGDQTTNEVSYTGYSRLATSRSSASWTITNNSVSPAVSLNFPVSSGPSVTTTHFAVGTASSGAGKILYKGTLTPSTVLDSGDTLRVSVLSTIVED